MAGCWKPHQERIRRYFVEDGMSLEEVMKNMEKNHGFLARFCVVPRHETEADSTTARRHMSVNSENGTSASTPEMLGRYGSTSDAESSREARRVRGVMCISETEKSLRQSFERKDQDTVFLISKASMTKVSFNLSSWLE
jgi:hypothetical protein